MDITQHHDMPKDRCPVCAHPFDDATDAFGNARPKPGDLSLCIQCGSFLEFRFDLTVRELSLQAVSELPDSTRIQLQRVRRAWESMPKRSLGEDS